MIVGCSGIASIVSDFFLVVVRFFAVGHRRANTEVLAPSDLRQMGVFEESAPRLHVMHWVSAESVIEIHAQKTVFWLLGLKISLVE